MVIENVLPYRPYHGKALWQREPKQDWNLDCPLPADTLGYLSPASRFNHYLQGPKVSRQTSILSKNLWPPKILHGIPASCKALSIGRDSALYRTEIAKADKQRAKHVLCKQDPRKITKSLQRKVPPMLATQRLISCAMNVVSSFCSVNSETTGVAPSGCEVCNVFGIRVLSATATL